MWKELIYVAIGSGVGGALRYATSLLVKYNGGFPWATFVVNIAGCLLIGLIWGWMSRVNTDLQNLYLFLSVGLCGGLTTFSTFSKESWMLLQNGQYGLLVAYLLLSIGLGLACVVAGYMVLKHNG